VDCKASSEGVGIAADTRLSGQYLEDCHKAGGADGIRTHYLLTASQTLSQLSYSPVWFKNIPEQVGKLKLGDQLTAG
jgi:hypothetical protein